MKSENSYGRFINSCSSVIRGMVSILQITWLEGSTSAASPFGRCSSFLVFFKRSTKALGITIPPFSIRFSGIRTSWMRMLSLFATAIFMLLLPISNPILAFAILTLLLLQQNDFSSFLFISQKNPRYQASTGSPYHTVSRQAADRKGPKGIPAFRLLLPFKAAATSPRAQARSRSRSICIQSR